MMKRILAVAFLIFVLSIPRAYAQVEQGMMMDAEGTMEHEQTEEKMEMTEEEKAQKRKMEMEKYWEHIRLMNEMRGMTQEIVGTMDKISGMINDITRLNEIPEERVRKIGAVMKEVGDEVDTMSGIMVRGTANKKELVGLRNSLKEMQKQMLEMLLDAR